MDGFLWYSNDMDIWDIRAILLFGTLYMDIKKGREEEGHALKNYNRAQAADRRYASGEAARPHPKGKDTA